MKPLVSILSALGSLGIAAESPRPNIVLIMADDLGFSDISCYGSEIETPQLDALAREGMRFSQFYSTAKCHSSRVSLLTGLYCDQAGAEELSRGATIAEALTPTGYHCMMVGKWHLSKQPTDFGFQRYWGHLSGATNFFTGDDTFRLDGKHWTVPKTLNGKPFYTTNANIDFATDFIDEHLASPAKQDPFLLYVAFNAPHYPLQAPKETVQKYHGRYDQGWDVLRKRRYQRQLESGILSNKHQLSPRPDHVPAWNSLSKKEQHWQARRMEVFAAMVDLLDQNVGRLVAHLKEKGLYDNTLILFCSDNGACPFDRTRGKNKEPWDPDSYWCYDTGWAHMGNTPFRLYKQNQHQGGISSPLIAKVPTSFHLETKDTVVSEPGHLIDVMATLLEISGAEYPEKVASRIIDPLQGKSLLPVLKGKTRTAHDQLYFHFSTDRALRQGDWKLVSAKGGRWELYNLTDDPTELDDLAKEHPERVAKMSREWFRIARDIERLPENQLKPAKDKLTPLFSKKPGKKKP
ncbi:arylsulfatase [Haloferula chungangensis]|uniref:Arylsulfatase n=1 Tax=Haloferula chungangensis TaxID=1048331 RepID=A0ABW2LAU5_9BACT